MKESLKTVLAAAALYASPALAHEECKNTETPFVDIEEWQMQAHKEILVVSDPVYAGERNFTGRPLRGYESKEVQMRPTDIGKLVNATPVLRSLIREYFESIGWDSKKAEAGAERYVFIVKDAYRPHRATDDMNAWRAEINSNPDNSDDVGSGWIAGGISGHNKGSAVDVTLGRKNNEGQVVELWMGARFDEFNAYSYLDSKGRALDKAKDDPFSYEGRGYLETRVPPEVLRKVLNESIKAYGGSEYSQEFWHKTLSGTSSCYDTPITAN